jgi:Flp pilus assembly protein TadG
MVTQASFPDDRHPNAHIGAAYGRERSMIAPNRGCRWLQAFSPFRRTGVAIQTADESTARTRKSQLGQAMVEFSLIATALFTIIFGTIDFGRAIYLDVQLHNAVRDAGRYAKTETANGNARGGFGQIPNWVHYQYKYDASGASDTFSVDSAHERPGLGPAAVSYSCGACTSGSQLTITATLPFKAITQSLLKIGPFNITASTTVTLE